MRATKAGLIFCVCVVLAIPLAADAGDGNGAPILLTFEPTAMLAPAPPAGWPVTSPWPPNGTNPSINGINASAWMEISQVNGDSNLNFFVRGARPNTLYTIWTVFKPLVWCTAAQLQATPGCPGAFAPLTSSGGVGNTKPGFNNFPPGALPFYPEAGLVAPTAAMSKAFTSGMGLDPGATFYTDAKGDGQVHVKLDYNLIGTTYDDGPPVGNATTVSQCAVPGTPLTYTAANCPPVTISVNGNPVQTTPRFTVTSSWLRKFIIQVNDPASECANYDPADPSSIFWQCIDPSTVDPKTGTGLPRVWRYPFDHFRLAAHPDQLTHGFIGGSAFEHTIDFVGRRCVLTDACP